MKKYIFHTLPLLILTVASHALQAQTQTPTSSKTTAAQLRSNNTRLTTYNSSTGGNSFTTSITNNITVPLGLSAAQQISMNTALYNFFNAKGAFSKLRWSDQASYQQQTNTLVQKLIGQLGAFLSPDQVAKFTAMKPASAQTRDPMTIVFY